MSISAASFLKGVELGHVDVSVAVAVPLQVMLNLQTKHKLTIKCSFFFLFRANRENTSGKQS
jgi:hypothetical protein